MATESSAPEAGWYPTPNGEKRFWDGEKWLALPQPDDATGLSESAPASQVDASATLVDEQHGGAGETVESEPALALQKLGRRKRRMWISIAASVLVVIGLASGGVALKSAQDAQAVADAQAAAELEAKAAAKVEAAAEAAEEKEDDAERAMRASAVEGIEASIKTMAEGHAAEGAIDGPIIDTSCSPVGGGSMDDLTESTTVFECFVANKDNGDGTLRGYTYNSTMNWSTGSYTYGLGPA